MSYDDMLEAWGKLPRPKPAPVRTKMSWKAGDLCYIDGTHIGMKRLVMYRGKVLAVAFSSRGDFLECKVEITHTVEGFDGKRVEAIWTHPEPIQSYKLRKRVE